jgi:hypothetical protein
MSKEISNDLTTVVVVQVPIRKRAAVGAIRITSA